MAHSALAIDNQEASTSEPPALGQELREIAAATFRLASELRPLLNDKAAAALDQLVQNAQRDACRIVVIGQAKTGKRTLVNAVIQAPFACATTIVDLPGPNDPFPTPGELAPKALESADAYIVVLNAQQALSLGDTSLLRVLQGLQKSRLVVFVNRVDAPASPAPDTEAAVAHVRGKLVTEFPGAAIPIIADSATRPSGRDDLKAALARLVLQGPTMLRLQRGQRLLYEMVLNAELAARGELQSLEQLIAAAREGEAATSRWAQAAEDLKRFNALPAAIMERVKPAAQNFDRLKGEAIAQLDAGLRDVIRRHVWGARCLLLAQPRFTRHEHIWQHDTLALRRDLEHEFRAIYGKVAEEFRQVERATSAEILAMVRDLMPDNLLVTEDLPISQIDPAPSISALGDTLAIELDERWRAWWRLWHGAKQRARRLEEHLSAAFHPMVDALLETADAGLEAYIVVSVQRFSRLVREVGTTLDRRKLDIDSRRNQAEKRLNGSARSDAMIEDYDARLKQEIQRLKDCARIAADLKRLVRRCAAFGH